MDEELRIRCRKKSERELYDEASFIGTAGEKIILRLKTMVQLNLKERALPQNGILRLEIHDKCYDLMVSSTGSVVGEKLCVRIPQKRTTMLYKDISNLAGVS